MNQDKMINLNINDEEDEIDLMELFTVIRSKIHIILLSGILLALVAFVGTKLLITPMYTSVTKLYVLSRQDSTTGVTYSDLQTGTQLTKDYAELVTSRPILEKVIAVLNLDMSTTELGNHITVETPSDTRFLVINVEDESPKQAKEIADVLREAVSGQITEIMHAESVDTIEDGSLPTIPSSPNFKKNMAIGGMLGILISLGVIFLMFIRDDTLKNPDDIERYLGLNVLTSIPIKENVKKSKKAKGVQAKKHIKG